MTSVLAPVMGHAVLVVRLDTDSEEPQSGEVIYIE